MSEERPRIAWEQARAWGDHDDADGMDVPLIGWGETIIDALHRAERRRWFSGRGGPIFPTDWQFIQDDVENYDSWSLEIHNPLFERVPMQVDDEWLAGKAREVRAYFEDLLAEAEQARDPDPEDFASLCPSKAIGRFVDALRDGA